MNNSDLERVNAKFDELESVLHYLMNRIDQLPMLDQEELEGLYSLQKRVEVMEHNLNEETPVTDWKQLDWKFNFYKAFAWLENNGIGRFAIRCKHWDEQNVFVCYNGENLGFQKFEMVPRGVDRNLRDFTLSMVSRNMLESNWEVWEQLV